MKRLDSLTIGDYIAIFRRRIWYVIIIPTLVGAATVAYVLQLKHTYMSETTIVMSSRFVPEDYIRSIDRETNIDRIDFVKQQLQSRTFLEGIVREFHLGDDSRADGMERSMDAVKGKIALTIMSPSAFRLAYTAIDPALAQAVTKRLAERVIELNDSFRKEKVQTADKFLEEQLEQAQNELKQAEEELLAFKNQSSIGAGAEVATADGLRTLQLQLTNLDNQMESATDRRKSLERRLEENEQLKRVMKASPAPPPKPARKQAPPPPPPTPLEIQLAGKRAELAAASSRYTALHPEVARLSHEVQEMESLVNQARIEQAKTMPQEPEEEPVPDVVLPQVDMVDLVPAGIQTDLEQVDRDIAKTDQARHALQARIASYETRLNPPAVIAQKLAELNRNYDSAKQRYTLLADKRLNSEMAARVDSNESNEMFKVVDPAFLPQRPAGPNRTRLAGMGGLAGIAMGFAFAFLRDFLDPRLHKEEDSISELQLPTLAAIPSVVDKAAPQAGKGNKLTIFQTKSDRDHGGDFSLRQADPKFRKVVLNPGSSAGEQYRLLRRRLAAMQKEEGIKSLLIVSSLPGEGKTFSACCIAAILAQSGKKVLLIDADWRKSTASILLGLADRKSPNSFAAILRGKASLEDSVIRCAELNLWFLPSGTVPSNPIEILSSSELEMFMQQAVAAYDWVIMDSPPIRVVPDTEFLSRACDLMLLVAQCRSTPVNAINKALKKVDRSRVAGVLLNRISQVDDSNNLGYGYSAYQQVQKASSNTSIFKLYEKD